MNNKFSYNLKKIRKDNNLSQEQLADELGVSRQAISKWEQSLAYPEMDKIITLCDKFNLNIDDLLHKDIREVKEEKNINKYFDEINKFFTNILNMFSDMSFKSKFKCLFEQVIIIIILLFIFTIIGLFFKNIFTSIFEMLPSNIYYYLYMMFSILYKLIAVMSIVTIVFHLFKTRYLDYYLSAIKDVKKDKRIEIINDKSCKIVIRDPKNSDYKFIKVLFKSIIIIIKFLILCFLVLLFMLLVFLFSILIFSFLIVKTGIFFIGIFISILSCSSIVVVLILFLLNFVFNRQNNIKKMIFIFVTSLITLGVGIGLFLIGTLEFSYVPKYEKNLKTEYIELNMTKDMLLDYHYDIKYIESDNKNVKIEYSINSYCNVDYFTYNNMVYFDTDCDSDILSFIKYAIDNFNDKKIISFDNRNYLYDIKVYTTKENIELLENNMKQYLE